MKLFKKLIDKAEGFLENQYKKSFIKHAVPLRKLCIINKHNLSTDPNTKITCIIEAYVADERDLPYMIIIRIINYGELKELPKPLNSKAIYTLVSADHKLVDHCLEKKSWHTLPDENCYHLASIDKIFNSSTAIIEKQDIKINMKFLKK